MTFRDHDEQFLQLLENLTSLDLVAQFANPHTQTEHRLHRISCGEEMQSIQEFLRPHSFLIADGHHRYTTAYEFAKQHPEWPEAQRMFVYLVSSSDPGLILSAIHRTVRSELFETEIFKKLERVAHVETISRSWSNFTSALAPLAWLSQDSMYLITPRGEDRDLLQNAPASLFNQIVLESTFHIDPTKEGFTDYVKFMHDPKEVDEKTKEENIHGFWLKPMCIPDVIEVAKQGFRLPQKATFFTPKVTSGLLFHSLT